ncbi:MAG: hypothetical protein IJ567_02975 [Lachnospiraceae bacterium]|nr:hypothetical protein [Lachnospiraceae bacterium]
MTDNELILTLSDLLDKKLQPIKDDIQLLKLQNENDILPRLQNIEAMQADIDVMKRVIAEHSDKLQKLA